MKTNLREVTEFYAPLAGAYDSMTDIERRKKQAAIFLAELRARFRFTSVIDAGCGSGQFAIAAAAMGCATSGVDLSPAMLESARNAALAQNVSVTWHEASLTDLTKVFNTPADMLLCMGNTIPHLLDPADLKIACTNFFNTLQTGGHVVIHLLNYERILSDKERIVAIGREHEREFIRFYDFLTPTLISFNLLDIDWTMSDCPRHVMRSIKLRPYLAAEIEDALYKAGFSECQRFGDLQLGPFDARDADVLLIVAAKTST